MAQLSTERNILDAVGSLEDLIDAWTAANNCDALATQEACRKLGIYSFAGEFNKPELVVKSIAMNFDYKQIDNGVWVNYKGATPLTPQQMQEAIDEVE